MPVDTFAQLADDWIEATLADRPAAATGLGFHPYVAQFGHTCA